MENSLCLLAVRRRGSRSRGELASYLDRSSRDGLGGMDAQIRRTAWVCLATFAMAKVTVTYSADSRVARQGGYENVAITWNMTLEGAFLKGIFGIFSRIKFPRMS